MSTVAVEEEFSMKKAIVPMLAIITGMFMVILDSTVVNVALPTLQQEMDAPLSTMQWTITGYTLALAAVIPLAGWLMDRFGAKRLFLITITLFTIGSVLCSLAQTPEQLITFRVLQGIGGGMVSPIGFAMVFRLAPAHKIGAVMGTLGVPMLLAPAFGPIIAGYFVDYLSWHWIFLINLPVGILTFFLGVKFLPNFEKKAVPSLDILGVILAPIAFSMLAYGVSESANGWTERNTLIGLIVGGIALILFIIVELRQEHPLLELKVFKSSGFTLGVLTTWAMQIALFGMFTLVPYFLINVKGYSALETGWIMFPQAIASGLMMPIGGRLYDKVGARPLALTGLSFIVGSLVFLSRITLETSVGYIVGCLIVMGLGMGLSMMAINTHVLQSAPKKLVNRVTPLTTAAQQVMVSFAVAGLTSFLTTRVTAHATEMQVNPMMDLAPAIEAFGDTFLLAAGIATIGLLLAFTLKRPKSTGELSEEAKSSMMSGH